MAGGTTRSIKTKVAVEGEREYTSALKEINAELKALQSGLQNTEKGYVNQGKQLEALVARQQGLKTIHEEQTKKLQKLNEALENAKKAEEKWTKTKEALNKELEENNKRLQELQEAGKGSSKEAKELTARNEEISKSLEVCDSKLSKVHVSMSGYQDQINRTEIELKDIDKELKDNKDIIDQVNQGTLEVTGATKDYSESLEESAKASDADINALRAMLEMLTKVANAFKECANIAAEFESAMAGVQKTSDMSATELDSMGDAIKDLATKIPATTTEIAGVVEAAGQLGIAKNDLLDFATVMVNLGVATNLTSEEAASSLAKFANVVGMSSANYERLGSTIVALGNNFATTEADIVSMSTRLASTGAIVGLSESQIMAISTALSSVGIEAEAGGSAISKLLKNFETMVATGSPKLEKFAEVAGMSADEFSQAWGEDAVGALSAFINGLGKVDASGQSAVAVLDDLDIKEVRMSNAVLALATSNGILDKALTTANNAWEENSALANEAAIRYETTESKMQMLANSANNVKIAIGEQLTAAFRGYADVSIDVLKKIERFFEAHETAGPVLAALVAGLAAVVVAVTAYTAAVKFAEAAQAAWNAVMNSNPILLVATACVVALAGIVALTKATEAEKVQLEDLTEAADKASMSMKDANQAYLDNEASILGAASVAEDYIARLEELDSKTNLTAEEQQEYHNILVLLCSTVPELAQYIDLETDKINGGTDALKANTEAWKQNAIQQATQEKMQQIYAAYADVLVEAEANQVKLTQAENEELDQKKLLTQYREEERRLLDEAAEAAEKYAEETGGSADATQFYSARLLELQEIIQDTNDRIFDAQEAQETIQKAIDADAEAVAAARAEMEVYTEAFGALTGAEQENTDAARENADAQAEIEGAEQKTIAVTQELANKYKEAYDAAAKSISSQIGLFDDFAAAISDDTDTVEEMLDRWAKQTANLSTYTENLQKAAIYGLDEGLIASLSDGSAESAGYLQTIISKIEDLGGTTEGMSADAEEFVGEFNAAFAETAQAKDNFAATTAGMQTDFDTAIAAMQQSADDADFSGLSEAIKRTFNTIKQDTQTAGADAASGLAQGITNGSGDVQNAATGVANDANDAIRSGLGEHSPSTIWKSAGENADTGLAQGITGKKTDVLKAIDTMAKEMNKSLKNAATDAVKAFTSGFDSINSQLSSKLNGLKSTVSSATSGISSSMYSVGSNAIQGMINGLNAKSGSLYSAMTRIVNNAMARAKSAAKVQSPSKVTTEMFEYVGEGMIVGIENKRRKLEDTMDDIVTSALDLDVSGKVNAVIEGIDETIPDITTDATAEKMDAVTRLLTGSGGLFSFLERVEDKMDRILEKDTSMYIDGKKVTRAIAKDMNEALGTLSRQEARGMA